MSSIPELEAIRRSQILEAAMVAIAANGHANVTMDDICRASGLSKGGLAHYFRSKNELFKSAFKAFFDRIFEQSRSTMSEFDDPFEKVLSCSWLYDENYPDRETGYPLLFDCISIAVHQLDYRKLYHKWVENWIELLKSALNEANDNGMLEKIDTEATARTISAIYNGIATRWYVDRESHSSQWAVSSFTNAIKRLLAPHIIAQPE